MLKNATVSLSYQVLGSQLTRGSYEYRERTTTGSLLEEDRRLFITTRPKNSECKIVVNLCEAFVNHAISDDGRPNRDESFRAHAKWKKMSDTERLQWHISQYVEAMGSSSYEYQIMEA